MFECANLNLYLQPPKTQEEVQKFMYHTPQQKDISMFQFFKNEINWVANYMKTTKPITINIKSSSAFDEKMCLSLQQEEM